MNLTPLWILSIAYITIIKISSIDSTRVVCYYTNWSVYRRDNATYGIQYLNPNLCTHLIYAFARITNEDTIDSTDSYQDIKNGGYDKFTGIKANNKNLKTLISIRSNDMSSRFSPLVADESKKQMFTQNAIKFLRQHNFDGLDLDWQHPTFGNDSKPEDRANYGQFVQELREAFDWESSKLGETRLLLTVTIPPFADIIDQGYDVVKLNQYIDWFNVVAYNYQKSIPTTTHLAPLYQIDGTDLTHNIDFSVTYLIRAGAQRDKLVIGIPTYGSSYTLSNSSETGFGAQTDGPGRPLNGTAEPGVLAYFEICQYIETDNKWTVKNTNNSNMGPYLYKNDQWVSYDDEEIIRKKAKYVVKNNLGGIMFWAIDLDDFRGGCSGKPYPLIEAGREIILNATSVQATTNVQPILDIQSDFQCQAEGNFPHPNDCKKYFWCQNNDMANLGLVSQELLCPSDLLFNEQSNFCDYARNVNCTKSNVPTTNTKATTLLNAIDQSTATPTYDENDRKFGDPNVTKKLIDLIENVSGLDELEKYFKILKDDNADIGTTENPKQINTGVEVVDAFPNVNRKKSFNRLLTGSPLPVIMPRHRSDIKAAPNNDEYNTEYDEEEKSSRDRAPFKHLRPITIKSQYNNVSLIVLYL